MNALSWGTCWWLSELFGGVLYLLNTKHLLGVLTGPPNKVIDLFSDIDCISVQRTLKQPKLQLRRCGLCAMINTLPSQSLTTTRATLLAWYTSSEIESPSFFLGFDVIALGTTASHGPPIFFFSISSNKVLCVSWLQQQLLKWVWWFSGQYGYSSELFPAEDVMIKVCVPQT